MATHNIKKCPSLGEIKLTYIINDLYGEREAFRFSTSTSKKLRKILQVVIAKLDMINAKQYKITKHWKNQSVTQECLIHIQQNDNNHKMRVNNLIT